MAGWASEGTGEGGAAAESGFDLQEGVSVKGVQETMASS